MASKFISVFSICAIILGVYILVSAIIGTDPSLSAKYHIGCYLTNDTHDHHHHITTSLNNLKQRKHKSRAGLNMHRSLALSNSDLRQKSVKIAKEFQNYIQKIAISGAHQKNNQQFYFQLQNSFQNYQNCKQEINLNIDQKNCKDNWEDYQKCSNQMDDIKHNMEKQIKQRQIINEKIKTVLSPGSTDKKLDLDALIKKIQQKYKQLNEANDKKRSQIKSDLIKQQNKVQIKQNRLHQLQMQYTSIQNEYLSCFNNLKDFNACQNITSAINSYGYIETIDGIQKRINNKRQTLGKMVKIIREQNGAGKQSISKLISKGQQQLAQLIKLNVDIQLQQKDSLCGCTQGQKKTLQNSKLKLSKQINQLKGQIDQIDIFAKSLQNKLRSLESLSESLLKQYNQQINKILGIKIEHGHASQSLQLLKFQLKVINENILNYNRILNSLVYDCNQKKDRLAKRFSQTDQLKKCLLKKDYYEKLKSKAKQILYDDPSNEAAKVKLINSLKQIQWQKALQNKNQILKKQISNDNEQQSKIALELINQILEQQASQKLQLQQGSESEDNTQNQVKKESSTQQQL